ncbi:hypothetical protein [Streptomyces noursei]|uniref:Uncharacterized protein n=1 Tax=Streptomyces noursei TaxID=1971 RepID=A0A2N8P8F4_STRNR|nr:hypothetical protein [Streptomyces noursei]PNE37297.1 hypothetical protein AOB60_23365 [Streptomyces noursei]
MNPDSAQDPPARNIRRGYALAGAVLAVVWLGEADEPAWVHGLRTAFILLVFPPLLLWTERRLTAAYQTSAHPGRVLARLITARTLIASTALISGHLLGRLLYPEAARGVTVLGLQLLLVLLTVPVKIRIAHRARATDTPPAHLSLSAPRLICAKLSLISAALLAQWLIVPHVPTPSC